MTDHQIDCSEVHSPMEFHRCLAEALSFPAWYGNNLDALYDCLTGIGEDTQLTLQNWNAVVHFCPGFRRVLTEAAEANPRLRILFQ